MCTCNLESTSPTSLPVEPSARPKFLRSFPLPSYQTAAIAVRPDGTLLASYDKTFTTLTAFFLRYFTPAGEAGGNLPFPRGIAVDAHNAEVFVTRNACVQVFNMDGTFLRSWGRQGSKDGEFCLPSGLALWQNLVFVADSGNQRIQVFKRDGTFVRN